MTTRRKAILWLVIPVVLLLAGRLQVDTPDRVSGQATDESSEAVSLGEARTSARAILPVRYQVPVQEKPAPEDREAPGRAARSLVLGRTHRPLADVVPPANVEPFPRRYFLQVFRF